MGRETIARAIAAADSGWNRLFACRNSNAFCTVGRLFADLIADQNKKQKNDLPKRISTTSEPISGCWLVPGHALSFPPHRNGGIRLETLLVL